ncbi:MAG: DUF4058 family protein [Planctomycetaceae bacterium]
MEIRFLKCSELQQQRTPEDGPEAGGVAVAQVRPRARFIRSVETDVYVRKANRIVIKHRHGRVVAVLEIVSPGNKSSAHALRSFAEKAYGLIQEGIHLLVVDLFPPSPRDPQGIHKAIWDEFIDEPFELPSDKPLTVAAYFSGELKTAYVEPVAVGDALPELPIFLDDGIYVPAPLEATYNAAWAACPDVIRELVEGSGS